MILHFHSFYSLRYGTYSLQDLVKFSKLNGYDTIILADLNNSTGCLEFVKISHKNGIHPLVGMDFQDVGQTEFLAIAKNTLGFREINQYRSSLNLRQSLKQSNKVTDLQSRPNFQHVFVLYALKSIINDIHAEFYMKTWEDYEFIAIRPYEIKYLKKLTPFQISRCVIVSTVSIQPDDFDLHLQLRAIDQNTLLSHLQPQQLVNKGNVLINKDTLLALFKDWPEMLSRSEWLLSQCSFSFNFDEPKNKKTFTDSVYHDKQLLIKRTYEGFNRYFAKTDKKAKQRVEEEIDVIEKLGFFSYYLITDDICRFANQHSFQYIGRGSGANSLVAYCLGITQVDPVDLGLPFERFLNLKRKSMPDFDLDFSWKDRDKIYQYIFNRYDQSHVALMGAMSTFRSRSILRELGKVYGLSRNEIDRLVHDPDNPLNRTQILGDILRGYQRMRDFPNQRTIHASGVLITENPIYDYGALDFPPKGLPTTQFDMYAADTMHMEKFDILSQRGIGHILECQEIIAENRNLQVDVSDVKGLFKDPNIAHQLRTAKTIGCFYIESPAMRQLLTKLRCDTYLTLVAASSIIRPGVASSGMMSEFVKRYRHPETVKYSHPILKEQLEETYGVMVYQEDVMKIAHAYGGLDLTDADVLRRMMSGKIKDKEVIQEIEMRFFENCQRKGYDDAISRDIWRQMESFAGYSFNKAHSASYAVESYQSLFLKTYFPLEFMVSVLNNYGGFYSKKVYINELRICGGEIELPCVQKSIFTSKIEGNQIYLGFDSVLGLQQQMLDQLILQRQLSGEYTTLENLIERTNISLNQLIILIRVGALRKINPSKQELLWKAHVLLSNRVANFKMQEGKLFGLSANWVRLPVLAHEKVEDWYDEIEFIGFPVSGTLFDLAKSTFRGHVHAHEMKQVQGKVVRMVGDLVAEKSVRTKDQKLMKFGTFLDSKGQFFDTVHFPLALQNYPLRGTGLYLIEGKIISEFDCYSIDVYRCAKMPLKADPRSE